MPASALPPGGQWRVSLARALVHEPAILLVEGLDAAPEAAAAGLVRAACARYGVAAIATVSPGFSPAEEDRIIGLADGVILSDSEAVRGS